MIPAFVTTELEALGLVLDPDVLERLDTYLGLLLETSRSVNLTAIREPDAAWRRLIIDSLTPLPLLDLPPEGRVVDVGTGPGLPGMPLAITCPGVHFSLIDSTRKKTRFLESVIAALALENVEVLTDRVETLGQQRDHRETYDLAISRAVGPMPLVLEYSLPLVKVDGVMIAMKGPKVVAELEASGDAMMTLGGGDVELIPAYPETFENDLVLVRLTKESPTPRKYPRLPGIPKREPL